MTSPKHKVSELNSSLFVKEKAGENKENKVKIIKIYNKKCIFAHK